MKGPISVQNLIMDLWKRTTPDLEERHATLPLGTYKGGDTTIAWPGMIADPAKRVGKALDAAFKGDESYYFGDDGHLTNDAIMAGIDATGLAMTGGFGAGLVGGFADNAVGSAGAKLTQSASDLPMDLASRMQRAREMGFDTDQVLYHGTGKTFDEFNPGTRGNGTARSIYLTDNPEIADIYANAPNYGLKGGGDPMIYPVFAKSEKPLSISDKGPDGGHGWVMDNLAAALGVDRPPAGRYASLYDEARRQGYDQVQIREMTDLGGEQTQYIPLKPEYIRSVNAAFDPSKSDSANLLAANAPTGAAVPAGMEASENEIDLTSLLAKILGGGR